MKKNKTASTVIYDLKFSVRVPDETVLFFKDGEFFGVLGVSYDDLKKNYDLFKIIEEETRKSFKKNGLQFEDDIIIYFNTRLESVFTSTFTGPDLKKIKKETK